MADNPKQESFFREDDEAQDKSKASVALSWSYSKRSSLERCPRQYYYEYFASKKRKAHEDSDKAEAQFLAELPSRHLRAGDIVHTVIRAALLKAQRGIYWDAKFMADWGVRILKKDIEHSKRHPDELSESPEAFPPKLLMEYHYRHPDAASFYAEIQEKIYQALWSFASEAAFLDFREYGGMPDAIVERKINLSLFNYRVTGRIDLAYQRDGLIHIVDWKTGLGDSEVDDSLQLAVYALWAADEFQAPPENIRVFKAFLGSASVIEFPVNQSKLDASKARILQDLERMKSVNQYGEDGIATAFTPRFEAGICSSCSFYRMCYD